MLSGKYLSWLNDAEICKYNDHHFFPYTQLQAEQYIRMVAEKRDLIALQIIDKKTSLHIGNISLYEINQIYRSAGLGILIGEKDYWGGGYATEAISKLVEHGFLELGLNRIFCGTSEKNIPMQKVAEKIGMLQEGVKRKGIYKSGEFSDFIMYSILRAEYIKHKYERERET